MLRCQKSDAHDRATWGPQGFLIKKRSPYIRKGSSTRFSFTAGYGVIPVLAATMYSGRGKYEGECQPAQDEE